MRITKSSLVKIIKEEVARLVEARPEGDIPDMVGYYSGVYGEKNRRQQDPETALRDYEDWARDYMGAESGPSSSSVLATYIEQEQLSDDVWKPLALQLGLEPSRVSAYLS